LLHSRIVSGSELLCPRLGALRPMPVIGFPPVAAHRLVGAESVLLQQYLLHITGRQKRPKAVWAVPVVLVVLK
jgi:hypothetical protein